MARHQSHARPDVHCPAADAASTPAAGSPTGWCSPSSPVSTPGGRPARPRGTARLRHPHRRRRGHRRRLRKLSAIPRDPDEIESWMAALRGWASRRSDRPACTHPLRPPATNGLTRRETQPANDPQTLELADPSAGHPQLGSLGADRDFPDTTTPLAWCPRWTMTCIPGTGVLDVRRKAVHRLGPQREVAVRILMPFQHVQVPGCRQAGVEVGVLGLPGVVGDVTPVG